ncbi:MAG: Serine/threonine-protein kinase PknA [Myxococcales bacterium]|nr:Serine/threonine-protein kinase PknA [Myxococcales bacterium]
MPPSLPPRLVDEREFEGTSRFQLKRRIGAGGMGVVWEAQDKERLTPVALKTLRTLSPDALLRFKNEFRALQDLSHPNLVALGELIEEGGQWFFTMELVQGTSLLRWVRPYDELAASEAEVGATEASAPSLVSAGEASTVPAIPSRVPSAPATTVNSFDEPRLRGAFAQLAQGLEALHARGLVHRDVKPSNVLVTDAGRVVVLDFGVVAETASRTDGVVVGTAAYMAPEQAAGEPVGPAADWYALGTVLYQALTGRLPFEGRREELISRKREAEPPSPRALCPAVPEDLEVLCKQLLRRAPAARPDGPEVLRRLGVASPSLAVPRTPRFVGRADELSRLKEALIQSRTRTTALLVHGESGVGKSAVVRRFVEDLGMPDAVVLAGRCYERESVHYKAVDGAIDALTRWLSSLWPDEVASLLPREIALVAELFPVLLRVEAIERVPALRHSPEDPPELRTRAFAALRQLLRAIAEKWPLVIAIDDLQWADGDSLALLSELLRPPDAPPLLLVATIRSADENTAVEIARRLGHGVRLLPLQPLGPMEARELAADLLGRAAGEGPLSAAVIAAEAHGHPLFIDELVRHKLSHGATLANPPLQLDDALHARIELLDADARRVLELTAVAGAPLQQGTAAVAAANDFSEYSRLTTQLRAQNLVRTSGVHPSDTIEPYHDRVREAVLRHLDAAARKMRHGRLAMALEASKQADAQALALHFAEAGDREKAARYTSVAAEEAARGLAFDRAVTLYRDALALAPAGSASRRQLAVKVGDALANAGRGAEAARALEQAADLHDELVAGGDSHAEALTLELRRRAAEQFLRGGHVDLGLAAVRNVLSAVGMSMPESPTGALASLLWNRARLRLRGLGFQPRPASEVPTLLLARLDTSLSIAVGMGLVDTIRGADYQTRSLLLALRAGEPDRIARALAMEAAHSSAGGGRTVKRTARLLAAAGEIAAKSESTTLQALVAATAGITAFLEGRWHAAARDCADAERMFRDRCIGAAWEADSAQAFSLWALSYLGEMRELSHRVPRAIHEAEERGDLYAATNLRIGELNFIHLAADDIQGARAAAATAMRAWSRQGFHHQHWDNFLAEGTTDLYAGDFIGAWERVERTWPPLKKSLLLMIQLTRIEAVNLRGRAALASGRVDEAARMAKKLHKERMPWSEALGSVLDGGVAMARGDATAARARLATAIAGFENTEMALWGAVARWQLGRLVGGDEGATLVRAAEDFMRAQSVRDPGRVAATLAPGFP